MKGQLMQSQSLKRADTVKYDSINLMGNPFYKQALKLKLCSALKSIDALKSDIKVKQSEKKQLDVAAMEIRKSISLLEEEKNPLI
mmetsp:Transcript_28760/g.25887  ORF Transcript_28760/g.25887 Transcript_28760/m.25887 type:complete len:85 (-) Transcript_28760:126-380(-)